MLDELAVITRPGAASRQAETAAVAATLGAFRQLQFLARARHAGRRRRAAARPDAVCGRRHPHQRGRRAATGAMSCRRTATTVRTVAVDGCLHLKSAVTEVAPGVVVSTRSGSMASCSPDHEIIEVDPSEPAAANVLRIGDAIVCAAAYPRTNARLAAAATVHTVDVSELAKAEGAVTCCSLIFTMKGRDPSQPGTSRVREPRTAMDYMGAYVIANVTVKDPVRYEDYRRLVTPTLAKFGGRFIARGGQHRGARRRLAAEPAGDPRVSVGRAGARVVELAGVRRSQAHPAGDVRRHRCLILGRRRRYAVDQLSSRSLEPLLGLHLLPAAAARGDGRRSSTAATRSSCCRPAAASRSASRRRRWCGPGSPLVVSPLISLMKDQVDTPDRRTASPRPASTARCRRTSARRSLPGMREGRYRLLYVSPERLAGEGSDSFLPMLARAASASSRSTRRTASASGDTISGRSTGSSARLRERVSRRQPARLHRDRDGARPARHRRRSSALRDAVELVGSFDRPEPGLPRAAARAAEAAAARRARPAPRPGRHRLLHVAPGSRRAGGVAVETGVRARAVSRRACDDRERAPQSGRVPRRARRRRRRDRRVRHGHRPLRRALRRPRRRAAVARALPAGVRPRRAATASRPSAC